MKRFLALFLLVVSFSSLAQTMPMGVFITPKYPTSCKEDEQRPLVNWVFEIRREREDAEEVTFSFKTMVGACQFGKPAPYLVDLNLARILLWKKRGLNLFSKDPFRVELMSQSATGDILVELTFLKNKLFKRGRQMEGFDMAFYPQGIPAVQYYPNGAWYQAPYYYFPWNVQLMKIEDDGSELEFR